MKQITLLIATLLAAGLSAHGQGLVLNEGDTYTYQFSSLPFYGYWLGGGTGGKVHPSFDRGTFEPGDSVRVEIFEDTLMGTPAGQRTFTSTTSTNATCSGTAWSDLQGSVRFTMISGSVKLDSFEVIADLLPNYIYADTVYPVLEPSTLALHILGWTNDGLLLRLTGGTGDRVRIEFSADLREWEPLTELTNTVGLIEFTDPGAPGIAHRFYRARRLE